MAAHWGSKNVPTNWYSDTYLFVYLSICLSVYAKSGRAIYGISWDAVAVPVENMLYVLVGDSGKVVTNMFYQR